MGGSAISNQQHGRTLQTVLAAAASDTTALRVSARDGTVSLNRNLFILASPLLRGCLASLPGSSTSLSLPDCSVASLQQLQHLLLGSGQLWLPHQEQESLQELQEAAHLLGLVMDQLSLQRSKATHARKEDCDFVYMVQPDLSCIPHHTCPPSPAKLVTPPLSVIEAAIATAKVETVELERDEFDATVKKEEVVKGNPRKNENEDGEIVEDEEKPVPASAQKKKPTRKIQKEKTVQKAQKSRAKYPCDLCEYKTDFSKKIKDHSTNKHERLYRFSCDAPCTFKNSVFQRFKAHTVKCKFSSNHKEVPTNLRIKQKSAKVFSCRTSTCDFTDTDLRVVKEHQTTHFRNAKNLQKPDREENPERSGSPLRSRSRQSERSEGSERGGEARDSRRSRSRQSAGPDLRETASEPYLDAATLRALREEQMERDWLQHGRQEKSGMRQQQQARQEAVITFPAPSPPIQTSFTPPERSQFSNARGSAPGVPPCLRCGNKHPDPCRIQPDTILCEFDGCYTRGHMKWVHMPKTIQDYQYIQRQMPPGFLMTNSRLPSASTRRAGGSVLPCLLCGARHAAVCRRADISSQCGFPGCGGTGHVTQLHLPRTAADYADIASRAPGLKLIHPTTRRQAGQRN